MYSIIQDSGPSHRNLSAETTVLCVEAVSATISNGPSSECRQDSGFDFAVIAAPPTADEIAEICQSQYCKTLIASIRNASSTDCVMQNGHDLYGDVLDPVLKQCSIFMNTPVKPKTTPPPAKWAASTISPTTTDSSSSSELATDLIVGGMVAVVIIAALVLWIRQRGTRGQNNKHIYYNDAGGFDTVARHS